MTNNNQPFSIIKRVLREAHPSMQLLAVVVIMFVSLLLTSFVCVALAIPIFHLSIANLTGLINGAMLTQNAPFLKYLQTCQSLGLFVLPALLLINLLYEQAELDIYKPRLPQLKVIALVLLCLLVSAPLINLMIEWNAAYHFPPALAEFERKLQAMEKQAAELTATLLSGRKPSDLLVNLAMIAILPAIGEEFIFRGIFQRLFQKWFKNYHLAIGFSALVFSAFHMQFYGLLPRMVLGIFFGYLFYWSGNIWLPVLAHFFNNCLAVLLDFFSTQKTVINFQKISESATQNDFTTYASIVLTSGTIFFLYMFLIRTKN